MQRLLDRVRPGGAQKLREETAAQQQQPPPPGAELSPLPVPSRGLFGCFQAPSRYRPTKAAAAPPAARAAAAAAAAPRPLAPPPKRGACLLHAAAWAGDAAEALRLVAAGAAVDKGDKVIDDDSDRGDPGVLRVCSRCSCSPHPPLRQAVDLLCTYSKRTRTQGGMRPLALAAWQGHLGVVHALLEAGADVNGSDAVGFEFVFVSVCLWLVWVEQLCLLQTSVATSTNGSSPRCVNQTLQHGLAPLHYAAWRNQLAAAQLLIGRGAIVHQSPKVRPQPSRVITLTDACVSCLHGVFNLMRGGFFAHLFPAPPPGHTA
jgi:hypothetical protein